jgi:hypothetical protein
MGEPWSELDYSFSERMQEARDRAATRVERFAYLGAVVTRTRKAEKRLLSVAEVAVLWECSPARVRFLCDAGRVVGAYRRRKGKGRGYAIPAPPVLIPGSRGPQPRKALAAIPKTNRDPIPF